MKGLHVCVVIKMEAGTCTVEILLVVFVLLPVHIVSFYYLLINLKSFLCFAITYITVHTA